MSPEHPYKLEGIKPHKKIVLEKYPLIFTLKNKRVFLSDIYLNKKLQGIFRECFEHQIIRGYFLNKFIIRYFEFKIKITL